MRKEDLLLNVERASRFYIRLKNGYWPEEYIPLDCRYAVSDDVVPWSQRQQGEFHELHEGDRWGKIWQSAWLHVTGRIPAEWRGKTLALRLNVSGEALIFDDAGVPIYGLCSSSCFGNDYVKEYYELPQDAPDDIDLWIEATANGMFGQEDLADTPNFRNPRFGEKESRQCGFCQKMRLAVVNTELRELFYDVEALWELMQCIGENDYRYTEIVRALNQAFAAMDDNSERADKARACLAPLLNRPAMASAKRVTAVGHSHIDVGWLWPVKESIRKSARTFASQIYNIEHFPEFVFGASQPQNYQFIKDNYPALFEKIRHYVKEGRWEPQGGMWVEADCNLINGESMVRQFVQGMNFFKDEFGVEVNNLWLPDVFGYPASMPQIMLKSGCRHFLTQKLSKGRVNVFPFHTFYWIGVDGSKVLTHFPPENNYNSHGNAGSYIQAQNRFAERDFMGEFISLVGIGDGGGGPADSHIRRVRRCNDMEGAPAVKFGRADEYFDRVAEKYNDEFPEWNGELYLENHQGTFTTHALMKKLNRRAEQQLNAAELLVTCVDDGVKWAEEFDKLWKILLCNQFHDILPGSCIKEVYENSEKELADIIRRCEDIQQHSAAKLLRKSVSSAVAVNTLSSDCMIPLTLPEAWGDASALDTDGEPLPCQVEDGKVVVSAPVNAFSFRELRKGTPAPKPTADNSLVLENDFARYEFANDGKLVFALDKTAGIQTIAFDKSANKLSLYADVPNSFDAWNLDAIYKKGPIHEARCIAHSKRFTGPVRSYLCFDYEIGEASTIHQKISLANDSRLLVFENRVQWHETHRILRVEFPTTTTSRHAAYEIPYAYIMRPTYENTSWESALHEVAFQRYIDLSDADVGVALLNDCKYGGKINKNVMEMTLLRSPKYPDYHADMGEHEFTYALLPHGGDLAHCTAVRATAAALNRPPMIVMNASGEGKLPMPCWISKGEGISLEVVKKAEKDDSVIVRLVETQGRFNSIVLDISQKFSKMTETDLVEWHDIEDIDLLDGTAILHFNAFEIKTFRLE